MLGVRTTSRASVTVEVNGQSRTFNDGEGIAFPKNMGGKQSLVGDQLQFVGYGLTLPSGAYDDYAKVDPKGKVVDLARSVRAEDVRKGPLSPPELQRSEPRGDR